ncbi:hypothetical protein [Streptomyces sp. NPDC007991]|uniref:DUF6197 family protein n=1 Tax=Streptomyces sp. NPDC007991 TaxID=3364803 RepID=UPI0036E69D58
MAETREQKMAELARRAANTIDERGLFQGDFYDPWETDPDKCAVCAIGALRLAVTGRPDAEADDEALVQDTITSFARFLGVDHVPDWSDEAGRTTADVRDAYRRFGNSLLAA